MNTRHTHGAPSGTKCPQCVNGAGASCKMCNLHPSPFTRAIWRRINLYLTPIEMLVLELDLAIRDTTAIEDVLGDKVVLGAAVLVVQVHDLTCLLYTSPSPRDTR